MFLSVIIPIYNSGRFLQDCLDSLLNQDIPTTDYEIICINDGSTDNSEQIIQQYCQSNSNIIHLDKQNGGVSSARNLGLEVARGDWIWFVDSDDLVQTNIMAELRSLATAQVDRIAFPRYCFYDHLKPSELAQKESGIIASNNPGRGLWCSLYKRSIITKNEILFDVGIDYGEDIVWLCMFREYGHGEAFCEKVCYFYRIHSESAMHQFTGSASQKKLKSYIKAATSLYDLYKSQSDKKTGTADDVMFFLRLTMLEIAKKPTTQERKRLIEEVKNLGLFPFVPLKEAKLKKAYVTSRSDLLGKTYNALVMNSTKMVGFQLLVLWNRLYASVKSIIAERS